MHGFENTLWSHYERTIVVLHSEQNVAVNSRLCESIHVLFVCRRSVGRNPETLGSMLCERELIPFVSVVRLSGTDIIEVLFGLILLASTGLRAYAA